MKMIETIILSVFSACVNICVVYMQKHQKKHLDTIHNTIHTVNKQHAEELQCLHSRIAQTLSSQKSLSKPDDDTPKQTRQLSQSKNHQQFRSQSE